MLLKQRKTVQAEETRVLPVDGRADIKWKQKWLLWLLLGFLAAVFLFLLIKAAAVTNWDLSSVRTQASGAAKQSTSVSDSSETDAALILPETETVSSGTATEPNSGSEQTEPSQTTAQRADSTEAGQTAEPDGPRFSDTVLRPVGSLFTGIRDAELFQISETEPSETLTTTESVTEEN